MSHPYHFITFGPLTDEEIKSLCPRTPAKSYDQAVCLRDGKDIVIAGLEFVHSTCLITWYNNNGILHVDLCPLYANTTEWIFQQFPLVKEVEFVEIHPLPFLFETLVRDYSRLGATLSRWGTVNIQKHKWENNFRGARSYLRGLYASFELN